METGLVSLLKPRVRRGVDRGERGAKHLLFFMERPGILLSTTLMGSNICVVCSSNMAKKVALSFGFESSESMTITACIMSLILLNAEIIPKDWFRQFPYKRTRFLAWIFRIVYYVLYIPSHILSIYITWVNGFVSSKKMRRQDASVIMRKDLSLLLKESEKAGVIDGKITEIIDKMLYFHYLKVADMMLKREDIVEVSADATVREAHEISKKYNVSRMPVKKHGSDDERWVGLFSIYDLIFEVEESCWDTTKVSDIMKSIVEISHNDGLSDALARAKTGITPILAVIDAKNPSRHIGIISLLGISEKLFGF
jgi:CBS domain containing-hemolysin-like protein